MREQGWSLTQRQPSPASTNQLNTPTSAHPSHREDGNGPAPHFTHTHTHTHCISFAVLRDGKEGRGKEGKGEKKYRNDWRKRGEGIGTNGGKEEEE